MNAAEQIAARTTTTAAAVVRLLFVCLTVATPCWAQPIPSQTEAPRPNVLLIYVDDLGYGDLGSYGHTTLRTPNLDKLATEGVRLTNYYAPSALCSPSRAALLTGRHPYRSDIDSWIPANSQIYLSREEITLAELLKDAGYQTALVGKWHLNSNLGDTAEPQPTDQGFDYAYGHNAFQIPTNRNPTNLFRNGQQLPEQKGYTADLYAEDAIAWLKKVRSTQPFFLMLSMAEPHTTIENPPAWNRRYRAFTKGAITPIKSGLPEPPKDLLVARGPGEYYANVGYMDNQIGRVLKALKRLRLEQSTLVVFASDNGPVTSQWLNWWEVGAYGSTGGLRGRKHLLYEGGIKVPAIVRYPDRIKANTVSDELIVGTDLFTTIASAAGVSIPADREIDGIDVWPALEGSALPERSVLWALEGQPAPPYAFREANWKLLLNSDYSIAGLYNLETDPNELFDLASVELDKAEHMQMLFEAEFDRIKNDPLRKRSQQERSMHANR